MTQKRLKGDEPRLGILEIRLKFVPEWIPKRQRQFEWTDICPFVTLILSCKCLTPNVEFVNFVQLLDI